jgi:hypothetical protein
VVDLAAHAGKLVFDGVQIHWHRDSQNGSKRPRSTAASQEYFDADKIGSTDRPASLEARRPIQNLLA